jgi:hypothetical protein
MVVFDKFLYIFDVKPLDHLSSEIICLITQPRKAIEVLLP